MVQKNMKLFIALFLLCLSVAPMAQASVNVWQDPKFKITLAFPDDWMRQAKEGEDLRLHILSPQGQDHAACRVFANKDNRFLYVPPQGAIAVSQFVQDEKALQGLLSNRLHYDNVKLHAYQDIASLGKGPATMAVATFTKQWAGRTIPMQAIVFGGYVQGLETAFECEAMAGAWDKWSPLFLNMVQGFDFPAKTSSVKQGHYRNFMADGYVFFPVGNGKAKAKY